MSSPATAPFLHPGRDARVLAGDGRAIGWIGELHPLVAREWDLDGAAAFELDFDALAEAGRAGSGLRRRDAAIPAVLQDIAVVAACGR